MTAIDLDWQGPYPLSDMGLQAPKADDRTGVYLVIQQISRGPDVFVGSSTNLGFRFRAHIQAVLGLNTYIRRDNGSRHPKDSPVTQFWTRVSNLAAEVELCLRALDATSFAWAEAPREHIGAIEALIYASLMSHQKKGLILVSNIARVPRVGAFEETQLTHAGSRPVVELLAQGAAPVGPAEDKPAGSPA
ncbi:hypothetical protein [Jiella sp. M17.18]|uniref:hypothetical protein n=1 Tax=Jiella sp. M17.18 TaxID=3234247 RepID=UPI0034E01D16